MLSETINDISGAIQLALGPVFLLTGIAGMLNVMSGRLSRIIDRGRTLVEKPDVIATYDHAGIQTEMNMLERRRHITSLAITMCTVAALMICLVIVSLFLDVMFSISLNWFIGAFFILATLSLVIGLSYFLREVHLSSISVRIKR